ncbi:unnamed protein product [Linum trigynum]|uniref:Uncharacterized protein n=1 Tax=Linum trigynum TaxID=586398 RepID=A0AAV2E8C3_9ROSI
MLSTDSTVQPSPAPVGFETGRPPDTGQLSDMRSACVLPSVLKDHLSSSAMIVDPVVRDSQAGVNTSAVAGNNIPDNQMILSTATPPQAATALKQSFSYASALTGGPIATTPQPLSAQWTPVGEHDLIPGRRNQRESNGKGKEKDLGGSVKAKEKDLGSLHHGTVDKNSKSALRIREPEDSISGEAQQLSIRPQRSPVQDRKGNGGKRVGEERRNGKEILIEEGPSVGKGLLGPGPIKGVTTKKSQPTSEGSMASTSSPKSLTTHGLINRPSEVPPSGSRAQGSPKAPALTPPPTSVSTGPNGTVLQVIQISSQNEEQLRRADHPSPSTANRTKGKKSSKGRSKKGSPAKLNPVRPLQIWSPMKDRKTKSKSRMASLTLQEINAWTEAAQSATNFPMAKGSSGVPPPPSSHGDSMSDPPTSATLASGPA